MFINYLKELNQITPVNDPDSNDVFFDEPFFSQCLATDPRQSLALFKSLYQKYQHDRQIAGLAVYYIGLAYDRLHERDNALHYYQHLIQNYKDLAGLYAKALHLIQKR